MEKLLSDSSDADCDMEMEIIPLTNLDTGSELPPSPLGSSNAITQPKGTAQHTTAVVTSQPSRLTRSFNRSQHIYDINALAENMLACSLCCCIICCLFGSPFTLFCFVPAIILLSKVK